MAVKNIKLHSARDNTPEEEVLLVFGSQALPLSNGAFEYLRSSVWDTPEQTWISEVVSSLPDCWDAFARAFPKFAILDPDGRNLLLDLHRWLQRDGASRVAHNGQREQGGGSSRPEWNWELPNMILGPLVVLAQLVECAQFLDMTTAAGLPPRVKSMVGFCTGQLSAVAASLSKSKTQLRSYGATSVRLGMVIGAMVDAQEIMDVAGPARALAVAWTTLQRGQDELRTILEQIPGVSSSPLYSPLSWNVDMARLIQCCSCMQSYISVAFDKNRATVTTAASTASQLEQELRGAGFKTSEIGLHGRFHGGWYRDDLEAVIRYCDKTPELCLPDASASVYPAWSNTGNVLSQGSLHEHAIKSIVIDKSEWETVFSAACAAMPDSTTFKVVQLGPEQRSVPPSAMRLLGSARVLNVADIIRLDPTRQVYQEDPAPLARKEDDVAVVGMSIKVAGADDVDEFWNLLCEGSSQHREAPADRLGFDNVWRQADKSGRKWYGNFINDHDAFDHRFFKKTAREMSSTDPQQRHMLQVAYQAVEQSGYYVHNDKTSRRTTTLGAAGDKRIGCFIGVCSADYENNAACYAPNAFTAVGNLKSFIAGKISHYFGWQGPSLCIDSACSSSLVAVHQACRAVLSGECSAALAGGANISK